MQFCDVLKDLRLRKGYTKAYVAESTGITYAKYNNMEEGLSKLDAEYIFPLVKFYKIPADMFLNYENLKNIDAYLGQRDELVGLLQYFTKISPEHLKILVYLFNYWGEENDGDSDPLIDYIASYALAPVEARYDVAKQTYDNAIHAVETGVANPNIAPLVDFDNYERGLKKLHKRL